MTFLSQPPSFPPPNLDRLRSHLSIGFRLAIRSFAASSSAGTKIADLEPVYGEGTRWEIDESPFQIVNGQLQTVDYRYKAGYSYAGSVIVRDSAGDDSFEASFILRATAPEFATILKNLLYRGEPVLYRGSPVVYGAAA